MRFFVKELISFSINCLQPQTWISKFILEKLEMRTLVFRAPMEALLPRFLHLRGTLIWGDLAWRQFRVDLRMPLVRFKTPCQIILSRVERMVLAHPILKKVLRGEKCSYRQSHRKRVISPGILKFKIKILQPYSAEELTHLSRAMIRWTVGGLWSLSIINLGRELPLERSWARLSSKERKLRILVKRGLHFKQSAASIKRLKFLTLKKRGL